MWVHTWLFGTRKKLHRPVHRVAQLKIRYRLIILWASRLSLHCTAYKAHIEFLLCCDATREIIKADYDKLDSPRLRHQNRNEISTSFLMLPATNTTGRYEQTSKPTNHPFAVGSTNSSIPISDDQVEPYCSIDVCAHRTAPNNIFCLFSPSGVQRIVSSFILTTN